MPNVDPAQFPSRIEIFRAGRHVDSSGRELHFTAADIKQIAASYNAELSEAPIVVGHPAINGPAYGWTKSLHAEDGRLLAEPHQVEAQFAELHAEGRFKKKSASLFHPDSPGNPTPGKWYLRHIGFLGAQPPAVQGLRDAQFAAPADAILVEFMNPADTATKETPMPDANFAEREAELARREAAVAEAERQAREIVAVAERAEAVSFAEQLITEGRLKPSRKDAVVELLLTQPVAPINFAEADGGPRAPSELLRELLREAVPVISFSERSAPNGSNAGIADFAAPLGALLSGDRLELHRKALAYQAAHPNTPYITAVAAVGG